MAECTVTFPVNSIRRLDPEDFVLLCLWARDHRLVFHDDDGGRGHGTLAHATAVRCTTYRNDCRLSRNHSYVKQKSWFGLIYALLLVPLVRFRITTGSNTSSGSVGT